jgi:ubiquinone/menaquinone biosynthesis C-methylase UbiE
MNTATLPSAVERLDLENTGDRAQVFMHKQRYDFALKGISPSDTALEIGTGTGFFSKVLAEHCESYSGLEIDPESCALTRERIGDRGVVLQGDAQKLPFSDHSFSAIVALEVLEHLEDFRKCIREIHRVLTPAGRVVISVPYRRRGGKNPRNPYHVYEPGENELVNAFSEYFGKVEVYYQYFPETAFMTAARLFHFRRFVGLDRVYGNLWQAVPEVLNRVQLDPNGKGMRITLVLLASEKK